MNDYIRWCDNCKAHILTTEQMNKKQDCYDCQKKQADIDRVEIEVDLKRLKEGGY